MEHITINSDRSVTVPVELRKIGVQYDHNVNTIEFVGPRYSSNVDLSTMTIYINYILSDKTPGKYKAENVIIDDQDDSLIRFNWTITRNVTKVSGILSCLVCAKKTDEEGNEINHWNTDIFRLLSVSEGMENDSVIQEQYPDVITSLIQNVEEHDTKLLEFSGLNIRVNDLENNIHELKSDLEQLKQNGTGTGTGVTTEVKTLMLSLFKSAVYNNPEMQVTVDALEQKWTGSGSSEGEETVYYIITNNLTNVSSSNSTGSVVKGASYSATLTVNDGYEMESVTVTMGGSDISATAYANGVVTIENVTGNVVITANATATQEARTVYFANDDSIPKTQGAMNSSGVIGLKTNVRYKVATLPYSDGMKIHTYMMGSSITSFPPFILYDGTTYTVPEYETVELNTYGITLSGLGNPTVYVNMLGTVKGVFADDRFYYVTQ